MNWASAAVLRGPEMVAGVPVGPSQESPDARLVLKFAAKVKA
jgi:hypothetical protein